VEETVAAAAAVTAVRVTETATAMEMAMVTATSPMPMPSSLPLKQFLLQHLLLLSRVLIYSSSCCLQDHKKIKVKNE
jgi:hypothetical protein